jgi:hypothetical protein
MNVIIKDQEFNLSNVAESQAMSVTEFAHMFHEARTTFDLGESTYGCDVLGPEDFDCPTCGVKAGTDCIREVLN